MTAISWFSLGKRLHRFIYITAALFFIVALSQTRAAHAATFDLTVCDPDSVVNGAALSSAITTANGNGQADTITLASACTYTLSANLPQISSAITINGNSAVISGAGTYRPFYVTSGGNLTLNDLIVQNGAADYGGALYNVGTSTLTNVTLASNTVEWGGGAIFQENGTLTISNSRFTSNAANGGGGLVVSSGTATINTSTFDSNSASASGGGAMRVTSSAGVTITNSTFTGNDAGGGPAAVYTFGNVTITNSTIANNSSGLGTNAAGTISVRNSIITGNGSNNCNTGVDTTTYPNLGCNGAVTGDARLGAFNGRYMPLGRGSAAIDAGDNGVCPATDQAGDTRPFNGGKSLTCDLGAIEAQFVTPMLSINDVTLNEGNAGTTTFTFTVSLSAPAPPGGVTFDIATANGTATTANNDYVAASLTGQTIPAGSATYNFNVTVNGDTMFESNETFFVNVTNIAEAFIGDTQGQGTITNDDPLPTLSISDVSQAEGNAGASLFTFTVSLSGASSTPVTFDIATADGTATTADNDYAGNSLTGQSIAAASTTYTFNVLVNGDSTAEANETFFVNVTNVTGANVGDAQGTATILNDDVAGITVTPGDGLLTTEAGGTATFTIQLNSQPTDSVTIHLTSSDPTEGTVPASVIIPAAEWQTGVEVTITGVDDDIADGDVLYSITLTPASTDPNYAAIPAFDINVTNQDNDSAGITVTPTTLTTSEAGGTAQFTVLLSSEPTSDVTITFSGLDATEGTLDFPSLTFTASDWNVAQTVTVTGVDDAIADGDVTYTLSSAVTSADATYNGLTTADVTITNTDDDAAGVTITPSSLTMPEGASGTYQIRLASVPSSPVTLEISFDVTEVALNGSSASPLAVTFNGSTTQTVTVSTVRNEAQNTVRSTTISHAIVSGPAEYPAGMALPSVTVQIDDVPPPPPTPLCEDHNFAEGGVVRASTVDGIDTAVNCRVLYQNGAPTQWLGSDLYHEGNLGVPGLLELGVVQAVDIFSPGGMTYFNGGAVFCLRGSGTLIWLAASGIPRHPEIVGSYTVPEFPGFTCITLFEPGTLVLVQKNPVQP